jgi:hypothetical protein
MRDDHHFFNCDPEWVPEFHRRQSPSRELDPIARDGDQPMARRSHESMAARVKRIHSLAEEGRQEDSSFVLSLSVVHAGLAILAFLMGTIRLFRLGEKRELVETLLVGMPWCVAVAIVTLSNDRERRRLALLLTLGYGTLLLLYLPFIVWMQWMK